MTALPRSPTVLERYITMRTRCGSALTPVLNVDGLNLIQSQAAGALGLSATIADRPRRRPLGHIPGQACWSQPPALCSRTRRPPPGRIRAWAKRRSAIFGYSEMDEY